MLKPVSPLGGYDQTFGDIRVWERSELALVSLAVPLGEDAAAKKALKSAFKLEMPEPGHSVATKTHRAVRVSSDQVMLVFADDAVLAEPAVAKSLKGAFYTTNQTDAWVSLSISGAGVRTVLERLCPLDLHEDVFAIDAAERTVMEHMGVFIVREAEDQFLLMTASSSALSFLHAVETSINYTM